MIDTLPFRSPWTGLQKPCSPAHERRERAPLILIFVFALLVTPVRAHDPFDIWSMAVLRPNFLELGITMSQSTALRLIDPQMKARAISFENFAAHRERLEREAAALYVLTIGKTPLTPSKVEAELTDENDVVFHVAFPRPPAGRVHFHAAFLKKLGEGYGGILDISLPSGENLGWEQLSFENPNFEVTLPSPKPAPK